jgi:hypothetical protein
MTDNISQYKKRSKTKQLNSGRSKIQRGGAAGAATPVPEQKLVYRSSVPEKLNKYLSIKELFWDSANLKYSTNLNNLDQDEVIDKIDQELEGIINKIKDNIDKLIDPDTKYGLNFDLKAIKDQLSADVNFTIIESELPISNVFTIILELIANLPDEKNTEKNQLTIYFTFAANAMQNIRDQLIEFGLFNDDSSNISLNMPLSVPIFTLPQGQNPNGWKQVTNKNKGNTLLHSKASIQNNINNPNISNIDHALDLDDEDKKVNYIQKYFNECQYHQVAYNQKHNELIKLFDYLKKLLDKLKKLIQLIIDLCDIDRFKTKGKKKTDVDIQPLRNFLEKIEPTITVQKEIVGAVDSFIGRTQPAAQSQIPVALIGGADIYVLRGGSAQGPVVAQNKIVLTALVDEQSIEYFQLQNYNNTLKNGQHILISTPATSTPTNTSIAIIGKYINTDNKYQLIKTYKDGNLNQNAAVYQEIMDFFNAQEPDKQMAMIDSLDYVVENEEALSVLLALRNIEAQSRAHVSMLANRMAKIKLDLLEKEGTQFVSTDDYLTNMQPLENSRVSRPFIPENQEEIQNVLYHCYDLQILYLIKHAEIITLFKLILYFIDLLFQNVSILMFILLLFKLFAIDIDKIPKDIVFPGVSIPDIRDLLEEQHVVMNTVFSSPVANANVAAVPPAAPPAAPNNPVAAPNNQGPAGVPEETDTEADPEEAAELDPDADQAPAAAARVVPAPVRRLPAAPAARVGEPAPEPRRLPAAPEPRRRRKVPKVPNIPKKSAPDPAVGQGGGAAATAATPTTSTQRKRIREFPALQVSESQGSELPTTDTEILAKLNSYFTYLNLDKITSIENLYKIETVILSKFNDEDIPNDNQLSSLYKAFLLIRIAILKRYLSKNAQQISEEQISEEKIKKIIKTIAKYEKSYTSTSGMTMVDFADNIADFAGFMGSSIHKEHIYKPLVNEKEHVIQEEDYRDLDKQVAAAANNLEKQAQIDKFKEIEQLLKTREKIRDSEMCNKDNTQCSLKPENITNAKGLIDKFFIIEIDVINTPPDVITYIANKIYDYLSTKVDTFDKKLAKYSIDGKKNVINLLNSADLNLEANKNVIEHFKNFVNANIEEEAAAAEELRAAEAARLEEERRRLEQVEVERLAAERIREAEAARERLLQIEDEKRQREEQARQQLEKQQLLEALEQERLRLIADEQRQREEQARQRKREEEQVRQRQREDAKTKYNNIQEKLKKILTSNVGPLQNIMQTLAKILPIFKGISIKNDDNINVIAGHTDSLQMIEDELVEIETFIAGNKPKTVGELKLEPNYKKLNIVFGIMNAFNKKTPEEQKSITNTLAGSDMKEAKNIFTNKIEASYKILDNGLIDILKKSDDYPVKPEKYNDYLRQLQSAVEKYKLGVSPNDIAIAHLYEIIASSARVLVRGKPEADTDNTAPIILRADVGEYNVNKYFDSLLPPENEQGGGYNYSDIIDLQHNNSIQIGTYCNDILPQEDLFVDGQPKTYGPFSAVYPPQYNNFHIYANMFGFQSITELIAQTTFDDRKLEKYNAILNTMQLDEKSKPRTFNTVTNTPQNLMKKLSTGGSVVIFGYGFSGSGKTYSLIEGLNKGCDDDKCIKRQGGGASLFPKKSVYGQQSSGRTTPAARAAAQAKLVAAAPAKLVAVRAAPAAAPAAVPAAAKPATTHVKYDPSLLEQFIKQNADKITSVEFKEIYPLGINDPALKAVPDNLNIKVIQQYPIPQDLKTFTTYELIDPDTYARYFNSCADKLFEKETLIQQDKDISKVDGVDKYDLFKSIDLKNVKFNKTAGKGKAEAEAEDKVLKYYLISNRIRLLERHRVNKLRILATPNNDNSSRSFLQITINLEVEVDDNTQPQKTPAEVKKIIKKPQLVFFDMPGTENTVRIKTEFMGKDIFGEISKDIKEKPLTETEITTKTYNQLKDLTTKINITGDKNYVTSVQRIGIEKITEQQEIILFKYVLLQMKQFLGVGISIQDAAIGIVGRELAMFFNGKDIDSITETSETINYLTNANFKSIYDTFMNTFFLKTVTEKVNDIPTEFSKFYSSTPNKYCKIIYKKKTALNPNEIEDIKNIFNLVLDESAYDTKFYFKLVDPNSITSVPGINKWYNINSLNEFLNKPKNKTDKEIRADRDAIKEEVADIYFANPLVKYLYLILNYISNKVLEGSFHTTLADIDRSTLFYRASVFFIYKFINFIVKQGRGIVTNLEHLKFFFLSRTGQIAEFNKDPKNKEEHNNKSFVYTDLNNALIGQKTYIVPTKIRSKEGKDIVIQEKVNIGEMQTYRLLSVLQELAKSNSKLEELWDDINYSLDIMKASAAGGGALGAIFVMFTNIKVFLDKDTDKLDKRNDTLKPELDKLCTAEFDTLEFAESISSATRTKVKAPAQAAAAPVAAEEAGKPTLLEQLGQNLKNIVAQKIFAEGGGSHTKYRKFNIQELNVKNNKYRKTRKVQSLKKLKNKQDKNKILQSKTKKNRN